jgi:hypothetical protein
MMALGAKAGTVATVPSQFTVADLSAAVLVGAGHGCVVLHPALPTSSRGRRWHMCAGFHPPASPHTGRTVEVDEPNGRDQWT